MAAQRFKVVLEKDENSEATGILIPFDAREVFGTRARVPVRGKINGFPHRGSIFPMGGGKSTTWSATKTSAQARKLRAATSSSSRWRDDEPRIITLAGEPGARSQI